MSKQLSLGGTVRFASRASKQVVLNCEVDADLRGQAHEQLKDLVEVSNASKAENLSVAKSVYDAVVGDTWGSAIVPDVVEQHVDRSSKQGHEQTPDLPEYQKEQIVQRRAVEENNEVLKHERGTGLRCDHCHSNDADERFVITSHSRLID